MSRKYDVGVNGVWFGANYGSLLNGYATYKILKDLGYSVLMINKPNASANDWEGLFKNFIRRRALANYYLTAGYMN